MKIIAFGASSSRHSINKQLANYAAHLVTGAEVELLDLNDFELPLFSEDKEKEIGQPDAAKAFYAKLGNADAIVISFAEHNGSYTAAYKNLFDWTSRINMKVFQGKPMVLLATSPGPAGAASVLSSAMNSMGYFGGVIKSQLSLPAFYDNFDVEAGQPTQPEWQEKFNAVMAKLA
ncbi:MAG: NADPH-dependent FMN reductase [Shewanella sp.]|uniref:NADPH-dependent FMN reductase n=1 Tax=Shewanella sp. SNU WT4 TaxID=2590015 RepID=UPI00112DD855|nr:NAD(P)H-dependent oxidoreductase [Shewanella sp. SNU WT4]QDF66256.1 NAD(P)H-dependent oxidoreductase [Shewanella sp. SNU WT4]